MKNMIVIDVTEDPKALFEALMKEISSEQTTTLVFSRRRSLYLEMTIKQWAEFSAALAQNRSIQSLTFQNTNFPVLEDNIKLFIDALIDNQSLTTLCINGGGLGLLKENNIKLLINVLVQKKSLREISLCRNLLKHLSEPTRKLLADALANHPSITNLDLSDNALGLLGSDSKFFANAVLNKSLHFLKLGSNQLSALGENNKFLTNALAQNQSIESLAIHDNDLGFLREDIKFFANILVQNQSLTNLTLSDNHLGALGINIQFLAEGLSNHPSLIALDLSGNDLGSLRENITPLANAIILNQSITTLYLRNNRLNTLHENLELLVNAFMKNRTISTLDLSDNRLGFFLDEYLKGTFNFLVAAVTQNPSITTLNFSNNWLGGKTGKVEIVTKMLQSGFLTSLFLSENQLNHSHNDLCPFNVKPFAEALAQNQSLTELELNGNLFHEFTPTDKTILTTALCQNKTLQNLGLALERPYDTAIDARIEKNKSIVHNVKGTAVLIAFARANRGHPFAASVLPLIPKITELSNLSI